MDRYLDIEHWPRRATFEYFRRLANPFFNMCARVDVSTMLARISRMPGITPFLGYHHAALLAANAVESLHYRLDGSKVRVLERLQASTTVLRSDQSLTFVTLPFHADLKRFAAEATPLLDAAKSGQATTELIGSDDQSLMHITTIPWLSFTSFTHPRALDGKDSVPKLSFGRFVEDSGRTWMPVGLEVHHALMDGLHVGQFFAQMQTALDAQA